MAEDDHNEVYRVNKLLAIEDMDWSRQLQKVVSLDLDFFLPTVFLIFTDCLNHSYNYNFLVRGFFDHSLSVWDASCILQRYERQTGHIISREELDTGFLATELTDEDYNLENSVSFTSYFGGFLVHFSETHLLSSVTVFPPNQLGQTIYPHSVWGLCALTDHVTSNYCSP